MTDSIPSAEHVVEALEMIKQNVPPEGYLVGFSGGKDSVTLLDLVRISGVKHRAVYSAPGIDPPEVVRFIKEHYPTVDWMHPAISFWDGLRAYGLPNFKRRWCCRVLKKAPTAKIPLYHRLIGIRAEESARRRSRGPIDRQGKLMTYKPLFNWKEWMVWDYLEQRKLPHCKLYDQGFDRIGCVICFFISPKEHERRRLLWPGLYRAFEQAVGDWWQSRPDLEQRLGFPVEELLRRWYRHERLFGENNT
ncbi:MAG: phosphoadenosine phosphosulfate reductase family protein [Deltaproteobacteria bacterium]|nr:phosphoadenosine phosphosulfate reductase family protein [Deltaproteobacteria bacterium]